MQFVNERKTFTVLDDNGNEVTCEVLFTFESDETKKNYIIYTDYTVAEDGKTNVFASIYDPNDENPILEPIETDREWKIIESILESLQEQISESFSEGDKQEGENAGNEQ